MTTATTHDYEMFDATGNRQVASMVEAVAKRVMGRVHGDLMIGTAARVLKSRRDRIAAKRPEVGDTAVREAIYSGLQRHLQAEGLDESEARWIAERIYSMAY